MGGGGAFAQMNSPKVPRAIYRVVIVPGLVIACAVAIVDKMRFDRAYRTIVLVSSEVGGHPYSIGGWTTGQECVIRFDHPLTDDALRRLVAADPQWRRISLKLFFTFEVSDHRLAAMRKMVFPHRITVVATPGPIETTW